jgi:hypothetical protein
VRYFAPFIFTPTCAQSIQVSLTFTTTTFTNNNNDYNNYNNKSFLIARYLLRDWVTLHLLQNKNYPILLALDTTFEQKGYTIFLLLRLSPIIPFNVMNYIGGVTSIKLRHYVLSLFGILPGTILYCFIGATTGNLLAGTTSGTSTEEEEGGGGSGSIASSPVTLAATIIGIVLGLAALFVISYYAKKEFNKIVLLSQQPQQQQEEQQEEENNGHEEEEESGMGGTRNGVCVNSYHNS